MRTLICCTVFTILPLCLWRYGKWRRPSRFRFSGKEASQHSRCVAQHSYTVFTKSCAPLRLVKLRFFFSFTWKQYGKLDESERRTEEYDTLVRWATSLFVGHGRGRDAVVLELWCLLCFSEGHEVSVIPALPTVHRRGRVRSHFPAIQEVGCCVWTPATTVQQNLLTWQPIVPLF